MARIPGVGLAKGLSITLRHMLRKSVTQQYPEVKPTLPPRSRGVIALVEENCTSCMLCARECPDWCIYIDSHKETIPAPEGGRARQRNVLDRFAIDFALCMYCGICIEVCPFDALFWSPEFEYAEGDIRNLLHEKDKLATWTQTVPVPPPHDPGAEPPKELTAAPRRPAADRPARTAAPRPRTATKETTTQQDSAPAAPPADAPAPTAEPTPDTTPGTLETKPAAESPTTEAPETGPATPSRTPGRPRRAVTNVRGIRPPGALPPDAPATTPEPQQPGDEPTPATDTQPTEPGQADTTVGTRPDDEGAATETGPDAGDAGPGQGDAGATAETGPTPPADNEPAAGPTPEQPQSQTSSTGRPPPQKLSTASGEPQPEPEAEEQTSAASPRRRKMADPRSIRPPGRLGPDDTRESEEES
ncbi:Formate hydrogenlyase subunit 6/NADH:ubiquinone oxidoreductase subunit (chain I) [Nonomuraea solani]|uniref:NADH-quinone oxidoreductase subunit I n=1 Tax=Nonomuraea solani TaxID=1144553 RepID=A0A1H6CJX3_9ACTN|nr:NADH-quinone oxidoreductase subunit I [Nonomuraea solani]SEG73240.1 Formate hydrogenlyase subunit 6/NADH:ubiquinone oxidoreductase subunit (chain I) [Nonomuraea solani]